MRALLIVGLVLVAAVAGLLGTGALGAPNSAGASISNPDQPAIAAPLPSAPVTAPIAIDLAPPAQILPVGPSVAVVAPVASPPKPAKKKAPTTVAGTPCRSSATACVDLSANRAWLISDGEVQYGPVSITHGRKGFRTPPGTFRVSYKQADHVSTIYDAEMPNSVFFNGGIAFHQGSLKQPSHGCIHLSAKAAKTFFGTLSRGEVVQVVR